MRCIGLGPQTHLVKYDPSAPLHDRYTMAKDFMSADEAQLLRDTTLTINAFFGWDFNSCEALRKDGTWYPIDFANPCPDSQVTSLHYHFPWLVKANLRWSIFCAVTKRPMRKNLDWEPFYAIAEARAAVPRAAARLRRRSPTSASRPTSSRSSARRTWRTSTRSRGSSSARRSRATPCRKKVAALFPAHEVEPFTELFWKRIQAWRADDQPA